MDVNPIQKAAIEAAFESLVKAAAHINM